MTHPYPEANPPAASTDFAVGIPHLAGLLASPNFPTGDRAALRRMVPGQPLPLKFYGFGVRHLPENWENRLHEWTTIIAGMAIMAPAIHDPRQSFGRTLAESGFSENRLERLLSAQGETFYTLLLRAFRFLAAKNRAFNWKDAASLVFSRDPARRERLHLRIARDFYRAL